MRPTIRQLTYLCALADEGGFSMAANALNASQPALSSGLRELEKALGVTLVDRSRRDVAFTEAGHEAVRRAREILTRVQDFTEAVKEAAEPLSGFFRLGVIPTIAPFLAPHLLGAMARERPKLRMRLTEDVTVRLIEHVRTGAVDAALIALPFDTPGLETSAIFADPLHCVMRRSDPLAAETAITPEALRTAKLLVLEDGHCLRDHALAACAKTGISRSDTHAAASLQTLMALVAVGEGVTIVPAVALAAGLLDGFDVTARPVKSVAAVRTLALVWRPGGPRRAEMPLIGETICASLHVFVKSEKPDRVDRN